MKQNKATNSNKQVKERKQLIEGRRKEKKYKVKNRIEQNMQE